MSGSFYAEVKRGMFGGGVLVGSFPCKKSQSVHTKGIGERLKPQTLHT